MVADSLTPTSEERACSHLGGLRVFPQRSHRVWYSCSWGAMAGLKQAGGSERMEVLAVHSTAGGVSTGQASLEDGLVAMLECQPH